MKLKKGKLLIDQHNKNYLYGGKFGGNYVPETLKTPIEDLTLSVRAYNCLRSAKIELLGDLVKYNTTDLLKFRNFGRKSLVEIEALLTEKGLSFGMDLSPYKLNDEQ